MISKETIAEGALLVTLTVPVFFKKEHTEPDIHNDTEYNSINSRKPVDAYGLMKRGYQANKSFTTVAILATVG